MTEPPRPTVSVAALRGGFRHSALVPPNAECELAIFGFHEIRLLSWNGHLEECCD